MASWRPFDRARASPFALWTSPAGAGQPPFCAGRGTFPFPLQEVVNAMVRAAKRERGFAHARPWTITSLGRRPAGSSRLKAIAAKIFHSSHTLTPSVPTRSAPRRGRR